MEVKIKKKKIFPTPQIFRQREETLSCSRFYLRKKITVDPVNLQLLKEVLPISDRIDDGIKIIKISALPSPDKKMLQSGAYSIRVSSDGIFIDIFDSASLFYALQTLSQCIARKGDLVIIPHMIVKDYPDISTRGVVEGFYGVPWSFEDRIRQMEFYGHIKMNTYIYGPKDDPYHSSPNWRSPYPAEKAEEISQLVSAAGNNFVDFVWAVHPGRDILWNEEDRIHMLNKFEWMYELGVRSFAVFFDDIIGIGTNPKNQAELMNCLQDRFINKYPDARPLILCPTEYNRSWANHDSGSYLDILGETLDPAIKVLWTGNRVISDIDKETTEWANRRLNRKIFYWWNFPVNDYVRDHLLMGPAYGNAKTIATDVSGFVCNPMEKAEASKIGIFGTACYTWNMSRYDAEESFERAASYLAPEASESLRLFAENNSDLGPNGHGYRREESVKIKPAIARLKSSMLKTPDTDLINIVLDYFQRISIAPEILIRNTTNDNLIREIMPWLEQFSLLGKAGTFVLSAIKNYHENQCEANWNNYLDVRKILLEMEYIDRTQNLNPYQPGVKTGSLVLTPFVRYAFDLLGNKIFGNPLIQKQRKTMRGHIITNIIQLEAQNVQVSDESISISPYLEPITLNPGSFIGLRWPENRTATVLHYNFNIRNIDLWGAFEVSPNGKDWVLYNTQLSEQLGDLPLKNYLYFVRFINNSSAAHNIYLNEFTVKTRMNNARRDISVVRDRNPRNYMIIPEGGHITLTGKTTGYIELFMELFDQEIRISNNCNPNIYSGNNNYFKFPAELLRNCSDIKITNRGKIPIHFFEIS